MKKTALVILVICLIAAAYLSAAAEEEKFSKFETEKAEWNYRLLEDGTAEIVGGSYEGWIDSSVSGAVIEIPDNVDGYTVSSILSNCWNSANSGSFLFPEYSYVSIPDSVVSIRSNPFFMNTILGFQVSGDHPVFRVVNGALLEKSEMRLVAVSQEFTEIPEGTVILGEFCGVPVTSQIPASVTTIENGAFDRYRSWPETFTIPDTVTKVTGNPFSVTFNELNYFELAAGHPVLEYIDGVLFDKTEHRLICANSQKKITKYTRPEGTEVIEDYASRGCTNLAKIILPAGIRRIGRSAFASTGVTSVSVGEGLEIMGAEAFTNCRKLKEITLPAGLKTIGEEAFFYCEALTSITIPEGVERIEFAAFTGCKKLKNVSLPQTLVSIGGWAFKDCSGLKAITIPESVEYIGGDNFTDKIKITGKEGSYAETYCRDRKYTFVPEK